MSQKGEGQKVTGKRALRPGSWVAAAVLLAPLLAAGSEVTSVEVRDPLGPAALAKVSVVNALTGVPIAAGITDPVSGRFSFLGDEDMELIVAVLTASGYAGADRVAAGGYSSVLADQSVNGLAADAAPRLAPASVSLDASELIDPLLPVEETRYAALSWSSFASVAFGTAGSDEHIGFAVPAELESAFLLCIVWQDGQPVRLKLVRAGESPTDDGGGEDGAFPTF